MTQGPRKIVALPDAKAIAARAAEWLVLLDDGEVSAEDRAAFQLWYEASEKHREAFDRLAALWGGFERAKALYDYAAADDTAALLARDTARARWHALQRRSVLSGLAASLVVGVGVAATFKRGLFRFADEGLYETAVGEQKTVTLPDGSVMTLNTASRAQVIYREASRDIVLLKGEAYLDVKPDKTRPFSVWSGERAVRAVGTAFTVRLRGSEVDVAVAKGRVALFSEARRADPGLQPDKRTASAMPLAEISAGEAALFDRTIKRISTVEREALARKLSWRQGVLAFSGEPLSAVVSELSRYTDTVVLIDDDSLRDLPVVGYFKIGGAEEMLEAIELMTGLKAERLGPGRIRFGRAREG